MAVDPSAETAAGQPDAGLAETQAGPRADATNELAVGATIGKYRLDRVLGQGGMGVVWAAFDPDLERPVAIKVLRSYDSTDTLRTRLLREARAMARLRHGNVLTVYEVGTDRGRDYIAMELIDGADLDGWLTSKPPRVEILAALTAAGRGIAAAHDAGLVHRDLKPHNILRGSDGRVYVTDFGLARGQIDEGIELDQTPIAATAIASGSAPRVVDSVLDSPLTQTGVLIGTPAYMAPEQFAGRVPDPRSDQFAFCVTAWEALTGARPFQGKTLEELRRAASAGAGAAAGLPPKLHAVLAKGLSPDPADRWLDMHVLLRELDTALAPPRKSRAPWIIAGALSIAAFLTGVALYTRSRTAPEPARAPSFTVNMPDIPTPDIPTPVVPMPPMPPMPPSRQNHAATASSCEPASKVFAKAWSPELRRQISARHKKEGMLIAVIAMLGEAEGAWTKAYNKACALPESQERHEQIACLLGARDDIAEATHELASQEDELSTGTIVPLGMAIASCGQFNDWR